MAEKKSTKNVAEIIEESAPNKNDLVEVFLPRASRPDAPKEEFYSFNFKNYLLKRGEKVLVPRELKEIIDEQMRAESAAMDFAEALGIREPE